jgi:PIN domain nuclease of toxin-antitoxin system
MLFTAGGERVLPAARTAMDEAREEGRLFLSSVSAWEIGLLMARGKLKSQLPAIDFFNEFRDRSGCRVCDITTAIFADSSFLPHFKHRDPADCLLVTTARTLGMAIVTRDRTILAYGTEGYVKSIAC